MPTHVRMFIFAILLGLSFTSGVVVTNWHQDSVELAATKAAAKVSDKFQHDQKDIADDVTKSLDQWKQNNVIVQERITREKLQPVFSNVCVTDEYVRLFNKQTNTFSTSSAVKPSAKAGN